MEYYAIGQRIRKARKARALSQEELAARVGISTTHMSHIETGNTKLSLPVLAGLVEALEVRVDDLLYGSHPLARSAAVEAIVRTLDSCTTQQLCVIEDLVRAAKASLEQHY